MIGRFFLDTNVLIYCFDREDRRKQRRAEELIGIALENHAGVISSQVVQEFLNVATRRFAVPMTAKQARLYLRKVLHPLCDVFPSFALFERSIEVQEETGYSFYDCLVISAALEAKCKVLYSEDLHAGHRYRGLTITNPFLETSAKTG